MQLIIEINVIKNCIEQLRSLAKQYESYTEVFAPSNFSVPSGTPLSRKLTDIRNNYRGIQINLQIVAQFLEYYVNDLENLENRMSNLGAVSSFHSSLSFGSISETSGLVDKPYEFPKTRLFDGASDVAFVDSAITEEVKYATFEDINKIMCGDELLQTKETQALMQKYHLNSEQALYILHKARGLQFGEKKADGKPYLAPEVLKGVDTQITPIEAAFFNNYMSLASTYQMDALNAIRNNSKSSLNELKDIEKTLKGYNFSSLEHYQNEVQSKYILAKDEAKLEINNFRTKQEWAARIGLSLDQVSKMRDDELIETIVKKDRLIGSDYKKVLAIGDKVGFSENDKKRLYKLQSDYNNSSMAILQLEENARVQPYLKVQETQDFQKFHYEVPKVKIEKHYDQHDSGFMYNSSVDEYTYYKNCQEQYSYVSNTEIMGMKNLEAVSDLQSIAKLYPEYEKEYYYYLETKGKAGAEQYLNDMKSTFARLSGEYKASKRLEYLSALPENEREKALGDYLNSAGLVTSNAFVSSAYGVGDGVTGWVENLGHIGDQKRYLSSHEWEKNYFRTAISSEKSRTEGKYLINENGLKSSSSNLIDFTKNYGTPVGFTYDVGQGVGNMLPTMVASSVFAPAGVASRVVGGVTMGAGIYGGTYHDYMVQGYDESTAHKAAALSAIAETATEELYGGFSFLNGGPVYNFKTGVINVLKEGGQEVFQDANDPIIRAIVTGEKIDLSKINVPDLLKKEAYTFVVGGATAGVMNLPGQVSSSHSIKVNQSNLNLLGNYYNNGNITMDQLHDLVSSTLGISELENSDIASILKFNKNGLSTISKTANGTINPDLVLALGEISAANNIVVQQRDLVKNTPALAPYVSNISQNENAVVPDGIKDAYTKYKSLEEKLNSYGEKIKNSAKQFQLKDDSVKGLNKKMQDLKSQHVGLEELLEKYDAGEKVHVSKNLSEAFNEYLTLRSKEGIINRQLNEIQSKVHVDLGHRVHSLASSVANSVASSATQAYEASAVVGIVPPVIRDIMNLFGGINSDSGQFRLDKKKYPKVIRQSVNPILQDLNISAQTGHVFESLFEDDEYVYGIHQAGRNKGETILKDGLRLTGHSGKNPISVSDSVSLTENIAFHNGGNMVMPWALRTILSAESYNNAQGVGDAVIFAFPKSMFLDWDTADYNVKPGVNYYTVDKDTQMKYLDPKYIVGYVTNDHGKVSNFNFNPSFLNSSFLEKNGIRTQVSQDNISVKESVSSLNLDNMTDGGIDNRYNQQMTLESLQDKVEFQTSYLQKFVSEVEQLCQENEEFRAYLKKKIRGNISPELQETIDKYKEIRKSYTGEQLDLIDLYYLEKRYFDEDFEGVDLSELSSDMYQSYTRKLRELQTMFFKSADVSEQVSFVQNSSHFACESEIISKFDEFDSSVQEAMTEKLLQEQTFIFENGLALDSALDFLKSRPQLFSRVTSQNLPLLYNNSSNKNAVFDEISARVKQGDLVFDKAFRVSNSYAGINYQLSIDLLEDIKELRPDLHAEIMSLYESKKTPLFHDITSNPSIHLSIVQEITLASLISQNLISESNVDVVLSVLEKNGTSGYVNFGIFQDEVIHDLGIDFVKSVARFPNVTATILDLKSQSNSAYQLFVKMVRDTEQNSTFAQEKLVKLALSYLTEHSTVNYDNVYVHDFEQFLLVSSSNPSLNLVYSNHFANDLRRVYENQLLDSTSLEEGRNAFFMAKYSMSLENVESLLHAYGANLSEVSKDLNSSDSLLIHTLMEEYNQLNLEKLKQMYFGKVDSKNGMQMLDLTDSIRIAYKQRYVDAFQSFRNSVEDANFYYKDGVKVIPVQGNFDLLFRSSNSSVSVNQKDSNSWVHAYEHPIVPSTVGLATCYVNQDNFGHMKTGDAGVLYGYVPSNASTIFSMGTQDINSQVISYGAEAKAGEQFILPSDMAKHNTRGYSEFEISFDNAKPDYVVLMSDASEQVRNNTFEAAKEWGIPVLEFDVEQLVHQQVNNIKSNIEQFRSTGDSQYLLKAISLYESSANSLGFNFDEINEDFFEDRSQLKELLDEIPIHQLAVEYAQVLVKNKNNSDIDKFKNGLQNILNNYKNTNENSEVVAVIPHTSNVTGIESVIDVLNQNSDSGSPSGAGDSFDQRYDSSIIENNDENIENQDNHLDDEGPVLLKTQNENNSVQTDISDIRHLTPTEVKTLKSLCAVPYVGTLPFNIMALFTKRILSPVTSNMDVQSKIANEGLYHFTSNEKVAQKILDSQRVKASNVVYSLGAPKSYFFAGIPSIDDVVLNLGNINPVQIAIKFDGKNVNLNDFSYRSFDDGAIVHYGPYKFNPENAQIVYLESVVDDNGNLVYKEISRDRYYEIQKKESIGYLRLIPYQSQVQFHYLTKNIGDLVSKVTKTYISDNVSSLLSHSPVDLIRDKVRETYKNLNLDFYNRVNFYNNQVDPTTIGELKQGIINSMPIGLNKLEQARFAYLALSQQLGFDENLQSNPKPGAFEATRDFYQNITDDTVLNRKTVCIAWAHIYSDILTSLGIDNKYQAKGHAWVEFDADGMLIKADATDGNVMDLTNVRLGLETQKFSPINQYSDPLNGKYSQPFYGSQEAYDSFHATLKQIDQNIGYIQDEYNTIDKKTIIADKDTTLTDKLKLFSSNYLDGLDFEGAKSLLLNLVSSLNNSGQYEISGTDMIKIRKDGKADIINITSILDENGQYRYFALHEGMGLTEITARDLNILRSQGYLFDDASKLKGYHYNAASGAVSSFINDVVSKVSSMIHLDLLDNTEANSSSFKSTIESGQGINKQLTSDLLQKNLNNYKNTNENSDSGAPSGGGDSLGQRLDPSIIENNDELGLKSNDMSVEISPEITEDLYPYADLNSLNSSLSEAVRLSSLQHLLNIGNQIINSPTFFSHPLQTTVASLANAIISKYMFNSNVVNNQEMSNKILNEGLYHFVQNDETMGKILDSHKFLASSSFGGGYVNTAFFFAGVPDFNETSNHIYKFSNLVDKLQGFRLNVDSSQLSEYQYRVAHDGVVMHLGDVEFRADQITPVYFVLKNDNGNVGYVEVSKEEYDNYESQLNKGIIIDQNILGAVNEYALNIDNVDTFKRVFSDFKIGLTNGQVVKSFVSNTLNLLNMIPGVNFDLPINQSVNAKRVSEDLQTRLETLRRENPGIEEEYIRIEKEMSLEHAVRLTPEMVEYRSIMHQLGLDKNNNVNNQQVETLPIEDDTFTIDDIKSTVLDVSLYNNKYFTVTLVDPKSIYAIIFDSDVYHNFMDFNNHRNEFGDISYPLYLKAIEKFISIELDGRNFGSEISQRIFSLLELINHSNDYLCPVKTYNIDETATSYQVKKNRLEALINQYPSLLTNKNDVPLEVIKEANLLQKAIQGSKYDSLIEASVPCLELSSYTINGELVPIPVELIEQILSDEKTYQAFQAFNHSRFIFGDVSKRDYYRAIMLYYLEAKKSGKSISEFKNLEDLLQSMNLYLTPFEVGVVNSGGAPVTLCETLTHNLKDFFKYLNPNSVIVSGENQYTVDEAMAILNNEIGVVPVSFYDNLAEIDPASFKIKLDVNEGIDDISWVDSVLNVETAFDELMNQFNYKMVSERIESLRRYVKEKGASITKLESERYQKIIDKHQQMRDVISLVQNNIFKKPELYSQIKDFVNKETNVSNVKIHGKEFSKDSFMAALDQINSGVQKYEQCRQAFHDLVSTFFTGKNSDVDTLRNVYNAFVYAYNQGYTDLTMAYLNNLKIIKNEIPEFCFTCNTIEEAFYNRARNVIELGKNSQSRQSIYHEITHAFDRCFSNYEVSSEWDSMVERTKEYILNNRTHDAFSKAAYRIDEEATRYADSELQNIFHKTTKEILHDLEAQYDNVENIKDVFMKRVNSLYGLNEEKANKLLTIITPKNLASIEYSLMHHVIYDHYLRNNYSDIVAISDMIDGIFLGKAEEIDKHHIFLPSIHGESYYQKRTHLNALEAIANYGSLLFTKNGLNNLKFVMGQEYVDMLNQKHHNIVWRNQK